MAPVLDDTSASMLGRKAAVGNARCHPSWKVTLQEPVPLVICTWRKSPAGITTEWVLSPQLSGAAAVVAHVNNVAAVLSSTVTVWPAKRFALTATRFEMVAATGNGPNITEV